MKIKIENFWFLYEKQDAVFKSQQPASSAVGNHEAVDPPHQPPQAPGGVHAQEADDLHPEKWNHHQVLASRSIQPTGPFRVAIASKRDILTCFDSFSY